MEIRHEIAKMILFEELSLKSALRKKMKLSKISHLPSEMKPFAVVKEFNYGIELNPHAWPSDWKLWALPKGKKTLALSLGHLFYEEDMRDVIEAFNKFLKNAPDGFWILCKGCFQNVLTYEEIEFNFEFADVNKEVRDFDFSLFASRPRHFNEIRFEGEKVTKISYWKEKGQAEFDFLNSVPESLRFFYPKPSEMRIEEKFISYSMKNQRRFDLGHLAFENTLTSRDWIEFYLHLKNYFSNLPLEKTNIQSYRDRLTNLFVQKLKQRLVAFRSLKCYEELVIQFQSATGRDFETVVRRLDESLRIQISKSNSDLLYFSHGDLNFSNILYDVETNEICLIDPRGASVDDKTNRPIEYDLAKLSLSAIGGYEYICRRNAIEIDSVVSKCFLNFLSQFSIPSQVILLYQASLFLSLLPLHKDQPRQLLQFMLAGDRAFVAT